MRGILYVAAACTAATAVADTINVPAEQPTIQAGIDRAMDGDEVVVAPGIYFETINLPGTAITVRSSGGPAVTTIDAQGSGTVVTCETGKGTDTVLDGFTVTGGSAATGGGMRNDGTSPTVIDCWFIDNSSISAGGGMYNHNGSPMVMGCTFTGNISTGSDGGGMHNGGMGTPLVVSCTFTSNIAGFRGGGIANRNDALVMDCSFIGNSAPTAAGGGMFNKDANPVIVNCLFENNTGLGAGGMYNLEEKTPTCPMVTDCIFNGNSADEIGGAMFFFIADATITNCMFIGNQAEIEGGGAIGLEQGAAPEFLNCLFRANTAGGFGGGAIGIDTADPSFVNCTFSQNGATDGAIGGAILNFNSAAGNVVVENSILWGDAPDEIAELGDAVTTVRFSDVDGGWPGEGNIAADPVFDDDLRLLSTSPCIDAADNDALPPDAADLDDDGDTMEPTPLDLDGNPRVVDDPATADTGNGTPPIVDMGAYEYQPPPNGDCPPDVNGDGVVDVLDLVQVILAWGTADPASDTNNDGIVDVLDLVDVILNWGPCE